MPTLRSGARARYARSGGGAHTHLLPPGSQVTPPTLHQHSSRCSAQPARQGGGRCPAHVAGLGAGCAGSEVAQGAPTGRWRQITSFPGSQIIMSAFVLIGLLLTGCAGGGGAPGWGLARALPPAMAPRTNRRCCIPVQGVPVGGCHGSRRLPRHLAVHHQATKCRQQEPGAEGHTSVQHRSGRLWRAEGRAASLIMTRHEPVPEVDSGIHNY